MQLRKLWRARCTFAPGVIAYKIPLNTDLTVKLYLYALLMIYNTSSSRIILKRPSNEDYMWTVYTKQFTGEVWGMLVVAILTLILGMACISCYSQHEINVPLSESIFTVIGLLLGQGTVLNFRTRTGRTLLLIVMLLHVVALAYYTSNMVSALTMGPPLPPYKGLRDIHQEPSITLGMLKGIAEADALKDSELPLYNEVWQNMKENHFVLTSVEGMERVFKGNYAFLEWEIFYLLNYGADCRAIMLPSSFLPAYATFTLAKDSPLIPIFNKLKWWLEMNVSNKGCDALETSPIELKTVVTPFILLGLSVLVSMAVLVAERCLKRHMSRGTKFSLI
ncbi:glutamate receptor 1-like [Penaeus japonicus]|uniref:glutamate receptor 1-like n=1 Tax=Penaeus japonicus TaxID=27405 RepID=UPI001C70EEA4|nr:glutamate receptor 1-like [Penaeus japonicus]